MATTATQSSQQIVVFRLGRQEFGIEIDHVREIIRPVAATPLPRMPDSVAGMINVRGKIIPIVDLHRLLDLAPAAHERTARIIIVETDSVLIGLEVDAATDVIWVTDEDLRTSTEIFANGNLKSVKGVYNIGERLIALVDVVDVLKTSANLDLRK